MVTPEYGSEMFRCVVRAGLVRSLGYVLLHAGPLGCNFHATCCA
jgi:hypothetical protein